MDLLLNIFSAFGLSASAGLNAYIPLLAVGLTARFTDLITLGEPWNVLEDWWSIGLLLVLSAVEFFADKIPAVNHVNDAIQTLVRPAAGAVVFAASARVITEIHPVLALALGLIVAGGVHTIKAAAVRPAVTATTGGAGNIPVSIAEDLVAFFVSILATLLPVILAAVIVIAGAWLAAWGARRFSRKTT